MQRQAEFFQQGLCFSIAAAAVQSFGQRKKKPLGMWGFLYRLRRHLDGAAHIQIADLIVFQKLRQQKLTLSGSCRPLALQQQAQPGIGQQHRQHHCVQRQ